FRDHARGFDPRHARLHAPCIGRNRDEQGRRQGQQRQDWLLAPARSDHERSIARASGGIVSEPLPRLLLVEDVPVVQAFLAAALDGLPLVVDLAGSVAGALRLAGAPAPALVLLDLHLPDGDGATALRRLRSAAVACPAVAL